MEENLTTEEVAALTRTAVSTVRYWHHMGVGPKSFKVGRRRLYAKSEVMAWIEAAKSADSIAG